MLLVYNLFCLLFLYKYKKYRDFFGIYMDKYILKGKYIATTQLHNFVVMLRIKLMSSPIYVTIEGPNTEMTKFNIQISIY